MVLFIYLVCYLSKDWDHLTNLLINCEQGITVQAFFSKMYFARIFEQGETSEHYCPLTLLTLLSRKRLFIGLVSSLVQLRLNVTWYILINWRWHAYYQKNKLAMTTTENDNQIEILDWEIRYVPIIVSDTVVDIRAVMIKFFNTSIAYFAVFRS